ncbi:MAG: cobalamin B12-binding domain-containing protein [Pirellulales bacterium]
MSDASQQLNAPQVPEFWLSGNAVDPAATAPVRRRILIGKPGLDGHDRGAKYVAQILRDAGHEVIYTGIRRTPEQIVAAAVQEDVDAIGLSLLSGSHIVLFARVMELLRTSQADDIVVFGGGVIPADDVDRLLAMGVKAVFTPGTPAVEIVARIEQVLARHSHA